MIVPFLLAVALVELTPGPNMGWLALVSIQGGRRAGLAAVAGVTLGLAAWLAAAAFGLTELLLVWPMAYETVRWSGVMFLLWLAWDAWRGNQAGGAAREEEARGLRVLFVRGLIGNLLNPKAALFYVALLPTFIAPARGSTLAQALILGSLHLAVAVAVHAAIVLGAARARALAMTQVQGPVLRLSVALGLAAIAFWMAWETRR